MSTSSSLDKKKARHDLKNSFVNLNSNFKYVVNQHRDENLTEMDIEEFDENIEQAISAWNNFKDGIVNEK